MRLPRIITLRDFDNSGIRFEVMNNVEIYRVFDHGGETAYTQTMLAELKPDDLFWDVGASIGLISVHAGRICRVFAFEPDPEIRARLLNNVNLNKHVNIEIFPYAISNTDGQVELFTGGAAGFSPSLRYQRREFQSIEVQARAIDSLVEEGLTAPTVLKLDIEGAEILALQGAANLLSSEARPRLIFLELHGTMLSAFNSSADEVIELLTSVGYLVRQEDERDQQRHLVLEAASEGLS